MGGTTRYLLIVAAAYAAAWLADGGRAWGQSHRVSCADCHSAEGRQFATSVHPEHGLDCHWCHGGEESYALEQAIVERSARLLATQPGASTREAGTAAFDHGPRFRGKVSRYEVPERCGSCHSDVARMNPFGLPTDQWAQYRISGHGRALYERHDDRVAVCIDCHGAHEILARKDPASAVSAKNVPATCGHCHGDPTRMAGSHLSSHVVDEYRQSVHGQGLLVDGDLAMPNCAGCHGSHSAVPPGFRDVGDVCGRCHQQENQRFLQSLHAKFELFPRCVGCHTRRVDQRDHLIQRVVASPEAVKVTYERVREAMPGAPFDDPAFQEAFASRLKPAMLRVEVLCERCHGAPKESGHRVFFGKLDEVALQTGAELRRLILHNQLSYAAAASRVDEVAHGGLLITDEALSVDEMRTKVVSLGPVQHTLDLPQVKKAVAEQDSLYAQIDRSLSKKLKGLRWRHWALVPMWGFVAVFVGALWVKYRRLEAAMVRPMPSE